MYRSGLHYYATMSRDDYNQAVLNSRTSYNSGRILYSISVAIIFAIQLFFIYQCSRHLAEFIPANAVLMHEFLAMVLPGLVVFLTAATWHHNSEPGKDQVIYNFGIPPWLFIVSLFPLIASMASSILFGGASNVLIVLLPLLGILLFLWLVLWEYAKDKTNDLRSLMPASEERKNALAAHEHHATVAQHLSLERNFPLTEAEVELMLRIVNAKPTETLAHC